jgi:hypothetical protein
MGFQRNAKSAGWRIFPARSLLLSDFTYVSFNAAMLTDAFDSVSNLHGQKEQCPQRIKKTGMLLPVSLLALR